MNYIGRFGLEFNPFLKNARHETVIETNEYKEVNYRLDLLLKTRGFGLITGTAGKPPKSPVCSNCIGTAVTLPAWNSGILGWGKRLHAVINTMQITPIQTLKKSDLLIFFMPAC